MSELRVVEICAGAGGQALGLHNAGFRHELAVELDATAAETLQRNIPGPVRVGDVADPAVWDPAEFWGVDLLAGGVPCPPFSIAGKQLGSSDERDLFAWAVELAGKMQPRALLLENVRGLAAPRFAAYRQRVIDRLADLGYTADWRLLIASDYGVPQLRPRFVLIALRPADALYFHWPEPVVETLTVGDAVRDLMGANGWPHVDEWAAQANRIAPTIVGGSKKHGGADLGPTRAKQAWALLGVDGHGVADEAPGPDSPPPSMKLPRLTIEMVARIQGWQADQPYAFSGRKTSQYRQIGNAFPPPVAEALGRSIRDALNHEGMPLETTALGGSIHDPVYRALAATDGYVPIEHLVAVLNGNSEVEVQRRITALRKDFELEELPDKMHGVKYRLGQFKGYVGQDEHHRNEYLRKRRSQVS